MRRRGLLLGAVVLALGMPGPALAGGTCEPATGPVVANNGDGCVPTPEECASGNHTGVYDGPFTEGRFAVCVGAGGHIVFYAGGNLTGPCGSLFVADQYLIGRGSLDDPNECP